MSEYMAPIRAKLLGGMACALAGAVMALAIPQALRHLVDDVLGPDAGAGAVWLSAGVIAGLGLLQVFFQWLRRFLILVPSTHMELQMRMALFDKLLRLPSSFHDQWPSGQLLQRSMSDLSLTRRWISFGLAQTVTTVATIALGVVLMFTSSWLLSLIYLLAVLPVVWVVARTVPRARTLTRRTQQQAGDLATGVEEGVRGIRVLKALGRGRHSLERFGERAEGLRRSEVDRARTLAALSARTWLLPEIAMAVCLGLAGYLVARGTISTGAVVAFFATAVIVTTRVRDASGILTMYLGARVARDRHYQVLQAEGAEEVPLTDAARGERAGTGGTETAGAARLELRGVGFAVPAEGSYAAIDRGEQTGEDLPAGAGSAPGTSILRDVDLTVEPGRTLALVGGTGSGKSILLSLVPRLREATSGTVLVDGRDAAAMSLDELRAEISVAFEEPTLFSASVRENVLMGLPDPAHDDARDPYAPIRRERALAKALETAAAEFALALPDGVETRIGEEGLSLSGGQRQRIALARAIAPHPRLLLLDDPLSALDTQTEAAVVGNLRRTLRDTTTIITAHRASTVALADRVALLQEGRVVAAGTHAELMRLPEYRHLMATGAAAEEISPASPGSAEGAPPAAPGAETPVRDAGGESPSGEAGAGSPVRDAGPHDAAGPASEAPASEPSRPGPRSPRRSRRENARRGGTDD
ncbi:ABC transporter ATP-binding protein/permease [Rothia sp. AR01]|uniref:ABC transporter ATP-binding protein/permease n=1 Tax=Rothia santali TaxID=2949643 RepID=A0A9X2H8R0_9MICC|nr:ABC transporter ATP-binding protein [Rothia santali]MCP3425129.1 ABC transporter ATP-binding protein/permease [Rothia santali]